jgi:tetratricopeptide (TPR) repeat protein
MPESYKKWILVGIAFLVGIFFAVFVITPSFQNRKVEESDLQADVPPPPPQFIEQNLMEVVPVEDLGVDIGDPQALARLGDEYFERGNYKQAIEIYNKVLESNPNDTDTYNDIGLALHYTGNSDLAEVMLLKGLETNPEYQRIWLSLGYVLKSVGKIEEARAALQKTMEMGSDNEVGQEAARMLGQL